MIAPRRTLSVLVPNPALALSLPKETCIRRISDPSETLVDRTTNVFVVVSLLDLPFVAEFVREANDHHHLRGLFVRDDTNSNLLPQILQRSNLRTVKSLILHSDPDVPARVLRASCMGAEDHLIADARLLDERLFLISCAGNTYDLPLDQHEALKTIPNQERGRFSIASDGAHVHWPTPDIHLDLEDVRIFLDPAEREKVRARKAQATAEFGRTVAAVRRRHGLRQSDIPRLSERQVRRYERGAYVPLTSLRLLAHAHGMEVAEYLDELAMRDEIS